MLPLLFGAARSPWRRLVSPGLIAPVWSVTRAQAAGVQSTALGADGLTWADYAADVARFNAAARGFRIEGQRTNAVRNPRCEGAVPGSPGTAPTHWFVGTATGLTLTLVGSGVANGVEYVDWQVTGTVGGTPGASALCLNAAFDAGSIAASVGQAWTASAFVQLVGGAFPNHPEGQRLLIQELNSGGGSLAFRAQQLPVTGTMTRLSSTQTLADASVANVRPYFWAYCAGGDVVNFTVRLGRPQLELGASASTPILPPVGTPGASTRGADLVSASLASLGVGPNGTCTILSQFVLPQAPVPASQALFQMDGGSDTSRYLAFNPAGGIAVAGLRSQSGNASAPSAGSMTPGVPFRVGVTIDGAGRMAITLDGGTVQSVTGGPTTGLTTLRLGNTAASTAAMFGETGRFLVLPRALSDAELAARVAAMPT